MKIAKNNLRMLARVLCGPVRNRLNAQCCCQFQPTAQTTSQVQQANRLVTTRTDILVCPQALKLQSLHIIVGEGKEAPCSKVTLRLARTAPPQYPSYL